MQTIMEWAVARLQMAQDLRQAYTEEEQEARTDLDLLRTGKTTEQCQRMYKAFCQRYVRKAAMKGGKKCVAGRKRMIMRMPFTKNGSTAGSSQQ